MFLTALGLGAGLATIGGSIYNTIRQGQENDITREREDTAILRRVADLKAAGLSPTLAAGSPADAKSLSAPQVDTNGFDIASSIMALKQGKANVSATNAQTELSKLQATSELFKQGIMQSEKAGMDLKNSWINADFASKLGLRSDERSKLRAELGQIGANTALLQAKSVYEQANTNYLKTLHENARVNQDILINNRAWNDYINGSKVWNNYASGGFFKNVVGGILGSASLLEKQFPNLSFDTMRKSWYYPK